jgi:4-diphosphocytidyl-2-C-methyl-D-erythritol kinase
VFLRLDLSDEVSLGARGGPSDALIVAGDPDCPAEGNLALRAAAAFRAHARGSEVGPLDIRLHKRIPMEAGLGGGSSDAAAVLRLLAHRHEGALADEQRVPLARSLGADVPFFLDAAGAALVSGVGEAIEPLPPPIESVGVLLARPRVGLSTGRVFGAWDALHDDGSDRDTRPAAIDLLATELRAGATPATIVGLAPMLRDANDLWSAAVVVEPTMEVARDALETRLGRPVLMTGSGSTLVALYADPEEASLAADEVRGDPPQVFRAAWIAASGSTTPYPPVIDTVEEEA